MSPDLALAGWGSRVTHLTSLILFPHLWKGVTLLTCLLHRSAVEMC